MLEPGAERRRPFHQWVLSYGATGVKTAVTSTKRPCTGACARVVLHRSCSRPDSVLLLVKNWPASREANSSHGRQRRVPSVWIEPV
jgi:hypothetical protein